MEVKEENEGAQIQINAKKNLSAANQLWYFVGSYIVSNQNGIALGIKNGNETSETPLVMQKMSPSDAKQQWNMTGSQIFTK